MQNTMRFDLGQLFGQIQTQEVMFIQILTQPGKQAYPIMSIKKEKLKKQQKSVHKQLQVQKKKMNP